jgi:hypothetical protein
MTDDWAQAMTNRIAAQIRELRGKRSVQWLEGRTIELGSRVSRSTISELETGQRKTITLADVIVLAAALEVPVIDLIYPGTWNTAVNLLPGVRVSKAEAAEKFGGSRQLNDRLVAMVEQLSKTVALSADEIKNLRAQITQLWNAVPVINDDNNGLAFVVVDPDTREVLKTTSDEIIDYEIRSALAENERSEHGR